MQIAQGEPGTIVCGPLTGKTGLFPMAGLALGWSASLVRRLPRPTHWAALETMNQFPPPRPVSSVGLMIV
jgi:hypothetical protein